MNVAVSAERIKDRLAESVYDNPVVTRDFRTRMRGWKAYSTMGAYIIFLTVVLLVTMWGMWETMSGPRSFATSIINQRIGQHLFMSLAVTQAILLTLIIPSLTSSSITQELEKKTMDMLAITRLTAGNLVLGRQVSAFLYALMLLGCSLPLAGLCMMFGGISPAEIAITYMLFVSWSFMFTAAGVFWSSLCNRTAAATLWAYGSCALYMLVIVPLGMAVPFFAMHGSGGDSFVFSALSPAFGPVVSLLKAEVSGIALPVAAVAVVLQFAFGALLIMTASTHVRYHRARNARSIRVLFLALSAVSVWLLVGNLASQGAFAHVYSTMESLSANAGTLALVGCFLAAAFTTGEIRKPKEGSMVTYALSLSKAFTDDLAGGISFVALWTAVVYGVMGATIYSASAGPRVVLPPNFWSGYFQIYVAVLAIVIGVAAVGILASAVMTNRKNAAGLVGLVVILLFAVYAIMLAGYDRYSAGPPSPVWHLAAFWPVTPILASTDQWGAGMPSLSWLKNAGWFVSSVVYLLIGYVALSTASAASTKCAGVKEEWL